MSADQDAILAALGDVRAAVGELREHVDTRIDSLERLTKSTADDQHAVRSDVQDVKRRVERLETDHRSLRRDIDDASSSATRMTSDANLKHESDMAAMMVRFGELSDAVNKMSTAEEKRAEDTAKLTNWRRDPRLQLVIYIIATAAAAYMSAHGMQPPAAPAPQETAP